MVIAGAGGHAREIFDVLAALRYQQKVSLFEEYETDQFARWKLPVSIVRTYEEVKQLFSRNAYFALGVGNPALRSHFYQKLLELGGIAENIVSVSAQISSHNVELGTGLNIMALSFISNNVRLGNGTLINAGAKIHHDCTIGDFCEISPNVTLAGNCLLGNCCSIGASATILPGIKIGDNVIVGAGSVVTKNVESNALIVGVPGKVIRKNQ